MRHISNLVTIQGNWLITYGGNPMTLSITSKGGNILDVEFDLDNLVMNEVSFLKAVRKAVEELKKRDEEMLSNDGCIWADLPSSDEESVLG